MPVLGPHCWVQAFSAYSKRVCSYCGVQASHCGGGFCCGAQALGAWASAAAAYGLSSCDLWV